MSDLKIVTTDELRKMKHAEGIIFQGCGGNLYEWIDGINDILTKEGILLEGTKFEIASAFTHEGLTNLLFRFTDDVKMDMGRLAMWRIGTHGCFGGTWLSDYVDNYLGGYDYSAFEKQTQALASFKNTEISFAFECDETGGWPVSLMWNHEKGKAWLSPCAPPDINFERYERAVKDCERFGIRDCGSIEDFNSILDSLGENAQNCKIYNQSEDVNLC